MDWRAVVMCWALGLVAGCDMRLDTRPELPVLRIRCYDGDRTTVDMSARFEVVRLNAPKPRSWLGDATDAIPTQITNPEPRNGAHYIFLAGRCEVTDAFGLEPERPIAP
mgnify:CR=1 FL=1